MPKNSIADWSSAAADNTDVGGINIGEGMAPSDVNNSEREIMAQVALYYQGAGQKFLNSGSVGTALSSFSSSFWAWQVGAAALMGSKTGGASSLFSNAFFDGTNYKYKFTGTAHVMSMDSNGFSFGYAASGSAGNNITFSALLDIDTSGNTKPGTDNSYSSGTASRRWSVVYAGTGSINTSDETEKDWRGTLTAAELAAAKRIAGEIGVYRWLSAIALKGDEARLHVGVRAQQVAAIMADEGLNPFAYGFVCQDEIAPGVDRWGIRPDELLFFLIAAQEQRLAALEA